MEGFGFDLVSGYIGNLDNAREFLRQKADMEALFQYSRVVRAVAFHFENGYGAGVVASLNATLSHLKRAHQGMDRNDPAEWRNHIGKAAGALGLNVGAFQF